MSTPIFSVTNHHSPDCGVPTIITDALDGNLPATHRPPYRSYFENCHGEQWIFVYDYDEERGKVYSGDCGWEEPLLVGGPAEALAWARKNTEAENRGIRRYAAMMVEHCERQLKTGDTNGIYVLSAKDGPMTLNRQESAWLAICWNTVQTHWEDRQAQRRAADAQARTRSGQEYIPPGAK